MSIIHPFLAAGVCPFSPLPARAVKPRFSAHKEGFACRRLVLALTLAATLALGLCAALPDAAMQGALDLYLGLRGIDNVPLKTGAGELPCYECGRDNPRTLVLLHGVGGTAASTWMRVMPGFCDDYHVLAPGLPMADMPTVALAHYTPLMDLRLVTRLIEERAKGGRADLAGLSVGGWLALRLAVDHPDMVRSVLAAAPAGLDLPGLVRRFEAAGPEPGRWFYHSLFQHPPPVPDFVLTPHFKRVGILARNMTRLGRSLSAGGNGLAGMLSQVRQPVLLLWGAEDRILPPSEAGLALRWLRDARLELIDDCGHAMVWDQPRTMAELMQQFLQERQEDG